MNRALAIEFSRVTEAAALAAYTWLGRGNKNAADEAAVKAMRYMLNFYYHDQAKYKPLMQLLRLLLKIQ